MESVKNMTLAAVSDGGVLPNDLVDLLLADCLRKEELKKLSSTLSSAELRKLFFSGLLRFSLLSLIYVSSAEYSRPDRLRLGLFCANPLISPLGDTAKACILRRSTTLGEKCTSV
jgi:hypothetical protein